MHTCLGCVYPQCPAALPAFGPFEVDRWAVHSSPKETFQLELEFD